jgi:hypothetical protein
MLQSKTPGHWQIPCPISINYTVHDWILEISRCPNSVKNQGIADISNRCLLKIWTGDGKNLLLINCYKQFVQLTIYCMRNKSLACWGLLWKCTPWLHGDTPLVIPGASAKITLERKIRELIFVRLKTICDSCPNSNCPAIFEKHLSLMRQSALKTCSFNLYAKVLMTLENLCLKMCA